MRLSYVRSLRAQKAVASNAEIVIMKYLVAIKFSPFVLFKLCPNRGILRPAASWYFVCVWMWFDCSYLHSCEPPVIHGNLTTDTIFIQHNGLIKIGSGTFCDCWCQRSYRSQQIVFENGVESAIKLQST